MENNDGVKYPQADLDAYKDWLKHFGTTTKKK